jgi:hypothetical protein
METLPLKNTFIEEAGVDKIRQIISKEKKEGKFSCKKMQVPQVHVRN